MTTPQETDDGDDSVSGELVGEDVYADIEWADDFEPLDRRTFLWSAITEQLRARPGKWARIPGRPSPTTTTSIMRRKLVAFRDGRWQAATRRGDLYVRYLGPDREAIE